MPTHKKPESERFKGPVKYLEYLLARALITVLQRLPIGWAYRLGRAVGWLAWKLMRRRGAIVRKNLEIVNAWMDGRAAVPSRRENEKTCQSPASEPDSTIDPHQSSVISHPPSPALPLEAQVKEAFLRNGANLFAGFTFNRMSPEQIEKHIRTEGIEHLKAALAEGKGAIILLAHMGPWEALAQLPGLAKAHGIEAPFGAVYRAFNNAYLEKWFKSERERAGTKMFSSRYRFYAPADFARNGGILGILADQRASGGERVSFFGVETSATPLPGLLHLRSKAKLLALSVQTLSDCKWRLRFRAVDFGPVTPEARRQHVAAKTVSAIETSLSDSVLDGFWFHNRFKDANKG